MCTVFGAATDRLSVQKVAKALKHTERRGPDAMEIVRLDSALLAFQRLSIMDLNPSGMQPFFDDGYGVVCNGEIYDFRSIKEDLENKGYTFHSQSDCEILIPLYKEYGLKMFEHFDGEFAMILYDPKTRSLIAARDPIGIRPLYFGSLEDGSIVFASEPANLKDLVQTILPFPPGCFYFEKEFHYFNNISRTKTGQVTDFDAACDGIREKLMHSVLRRMDSDAPLGFLLSGGLDSSLVCAIAAKHSKKPIRTFAIGMEEDAIDLKYAKQAADYIGSDHTEFTMTFEEILESLDQIIEDLATFDITTIRASIGMYLLCKKIREHTDIRVLLTGEVSDELFGYKYTDFAPDADAFQEESRKRISELHYYDVLRADRCIAAHSMEARVPFADNDFVSYVLSIDPQLKLNTYGKGKYLLRHAFEKDNLLPYDLLMREKAAFSDAVGHSMVDRLKEYAESLYSDAEFAEKRKKYRHVPPHTKEALLYREIFEKHYPGQSQMIPDFWMPNKKWPGCQVDDPSARVLSNYGASGC
jgi:asparagine synthase (glutamine-hydrolysing)